ncbi:glycosyltransferase family 2 protein, partial [Vibrio mimicus]
MNDVDSKVSIYMPTHNRANLVVRAVESVLKQSYKNIELIVVDDGSSDNSYELLSKIKDNRLIILRNDKPKGACYSRNRAIEQATGKYITGLDDDDYFNENRIEILLRAFDENYSFVCDNSI